MITGIYHSEDLSEYLQENHLFRRLLHKILRDEKVKMRDDVQQENFIWAALRYLYMSYFRHFRHEVADDNLFRQIASDSRNPIRRLMVDLVN